MASIDITVDQLLANDVGVGPLRVVDVGQPINGGTITFNGSIIRYNAPESGDFDSFPYTVADQYGQRSTATVHISIVGTVAEILAVDDVFERAFGTVRLTNLDLLANDQGESIDVKSVDAIPNVTKGTVTYSTATKIVTYQPPTGSSGGDAYPKVAYYGTATGTDFGEFKINGAQGQPPMEAKLNDVIMLTVIDNRPTTGRPARTLGDEWNILSEQSNPLFHVRMFARAVDQAFIDQYNASGDKFTIFPDYIYDENTDRSFEDIYLALVKQAPGQETNARLLTGEVAILQFGAFGGNPAGTIGWPTNSVKSFYHNSVILFNQNTVNRPTGSPDVYPLLKPGYAAYAKDGFTSGPGSLGEEVQILADYAITTSWAFDASQGSTAQISEDSFNYTIADTGGRTSTAKVRIKLAQPLKANPDQILTPPRKRYYTQTGSVLLSGHSDFSALGYQGTGTINVLGHRVNYDVTQLRQDMELILGPINFNNAVPGVMAKVVKVSGDPVDDTHDLGYLKIYRENFPFTDAEIASLPPLLFGNTNFGQEFYFEPYLIEMSTLLQNDTGSSIKVTSYTQPQHGSLEPRNTDDGTLVGLLYKGRQNFVPPNGDNFTYTIVDSTGAQSTTNVVVFEAVLPE